MTSCASPVRRQAPAPPLHNHPTKRERSISMAILTRFIVDLVTDDELPPSRVRSIAREMTDNLHILGVEKDDNAFKHVEKLAKGHVHEVPNGERCFECLEFSNDSRSGDVVLNA